jgi:hypothetical protein
MSSVSFADTITIAVPNEKWTIQLNSPPLKTVKDQTSGQSYEYWGTSGRLNVSLSVESPKCPGGDTDAEWHKCMIDRVLNSPVVVAPSVGFDSTPIGQAVSYLARVTVADKTVESVNVNILFTKEGKECNLHLSMLLPMTKQDDAMFVALVNSGHIVDK